MTKDLKPCPFCGEAKIHLNELVGFFWVRCDNCNAMCGTSNSEEEAIDLWNTRVYENDEDRKD